MEKIQNKVTRLSEDVVCFTAVGFEPGIVWAARQKGIFTYVHPFF